MRGKRPVPLSDAALQRGQQPEQQAPHSPQHSHEQSASGQLEVVRREGKELGETNAGAPLPIKNTFIDVPSGMTPTNYSNRQPINTAPAQVGVSAKCIRSALIASTKVPPAPSSPASPRRATEAGPPSSRPYSNNSKKRAVCRPSSIGTSFEEEHETGDEVSALPQPDEAGGGTTGLPRTPFMTPSPTGSSAFAAMRYQLFGGPVPMQEATWSAVPQHTAQMLGPFGGPLAFSSGQVGGATLTTIQVPRAAALGLPPKLLPDVQPPCEPPELPPGFPDPSDDEARPRESPKESPSASDDDDDDDDNDDDDDGSSGPELPDQTGDPRCMEDAPKPPPGALHPSSGSEQHDIGGCKRCCFFPRNRCFNGYECEFCHYEHEKRKRKSKKSKKKAERETAANHLDTTADGVSATPGSSVSAPITSSAPASLTAQTETAVAMLTDLTLPAATNGDSPPTAEQLLGNDSDIAAEPEPQGEAVALSLPHSGPPLWEPAFFAHTTLTAPAALNRLFSTVTGEPWLQTPLLSLPLAGPNGTKPSVPQPTAGYSDEVGGESSQEPLQLVTYQWTDAPSHHYFAPATGFAQAGSEGAPWESTQMGLTFATLGQSPVLAPPPFVTLPGHHEDAELQWAAGLPGQVPGVPAPHLPPVPTSCSVLPPWVAPPVAPPEEPQHGCTITPPPPPAAPPAAPPSVVAQAGPPPSQPPSRLPLPQDEMLPPSAPPNLPKDLQEVEQDSASGHDTAAPLDTTNTQPKPAPLKAAPLEALELDAWEHAWFPAVGPASQKAEADCIATELTTAYNSQQPPHSAGQSPTQAPHAQHSVQALPAPPPMVSPKLPRDLAEALHCCCDGTPPAPGESPS